MRYVVQRSEKRNPFRQTARQQTQTAPPRPSAVGIIGNARTLHNCRSSAIAAFVERHSIRSGTRKNFRPPDTATGRQERTSKEAFRVERLHEMPPSQFLHNRERYK